MKKFLKIDKNAFKNMSFKVSFPVSVPEFDKLKCLICGKSFRHLGSHLWHGHHVLAREYKEEFGLPYKMSLITDEIKEKKRDATVNMVPTFKKNFKNSKQFQFKKGQTGQRRVSQREREVVLERIKEVNKKRKPEHCPVCNIIFDNVDSHMANKHKLLRIPKKPQI